MNICLLGYGYWGSNVFRNLQKFDDITLSIVEPNTENWKKVKDDSVSLYFGIDEILSNPYLKKIEGAIICTSVSTHFELSKKLLQNKINVLCQKPLVETVAQAEELTEIAKENGVKLMTAFTYVYNQGIRKISQLFPEIGKKYYYDSTRINLGIIQRDTNVFWDLFVHDAAILYYLTYKLPKFISAVGACHNENEFIDVANVSLGYEDGFSAHCHVNWISPIKNRTIIFGGENKMVTFDDCSSEKIKIYDTGFSKRGGVFDYRTGDIVIPKIDNTEAIELELNHFFGCIKYGMEPLTNGEFSINVLKMVEAANQSAKENGQPVYL